MTEQFDYLNNIDAQTLLRAITDPRDRAVITLFLTTGIFVNELLELTTNDLNFEKKLLTIFGHRSRQIPLNDQAIDALSKWTKARPTTPIKYLFITQKGKVQNLSVRAVDKLIAKYSQKCNFQIKINAKILRNTFAVNLFQEEKISLKTAGEILGISDYESIKRYQTAAEVRDGFKPFPTEPLPNLEHVDTRSTINKLITKIFPTKPQGSYGTVSNRSPQNSETPEATIFGRTTILKEIETCLKKNQSVLLFGILGIGKTHILNHIAQEKNRDASQCVSTFCFLTLPMSLKDMLIKIIETIDPNWETKISRRSSTRILLDFLCKINSYGTVSYGTVSNRPQPILIIDNFHKLRTADLESMLILLTNFTILGATDDLTPKLKQLWWKFHQIEVKPLPEEACKDLIKNLTQNLTINDYELLETQLLNQANGIPLAIVDMVKQLSYKNTITKEDTRELHHEAGVTYRDWSFALIVLWGVIVMSRFIALGTHSFEGYILAGLGTSVLVVVRFFLFRMR